MRRIVLWFLFAFILLMVVIGLNRIIYNKAQDFTRRTEHSRNVIRLYQNLSIQLRGAEIYSFTYKQPALQSYSVYSDDVQNLPDDMASLRQAVDDNPEQIKIIDSIREIVDKHLPLLKKEDKPDIINDGEAWRYTDLHKTHTLIETGLLIEEKVLQKRRNELIESNRLNNTLTLLISIFAVLIITITFFTHFFLSKKSMRLEGFLESVLNTSQNGIMHARAIRQRGQVVDFVLEFANKASRNFLHEEPAKLLGKFWNEIDAFKTSALFNICANVIATSRPVEMEYLHQQPGEDRWFVLALAKMGDGVTISFYESTIIKDTEKALKKNIAALENSNRELEEYAYAASHDLQEPLRKIRTFGGFLKDTQHSRLDDKGRQQLDKMLQSAERMSMLIRDLLSFSGLKKEEEFIATDLSVILDNVLQDLEILIAQKEAIVTYQPLPSITAIPVQMNQLFYNLVFNALKFAKEEPLHLKINYRTITSQEAGLITNLEGHSPYYEISFSDNGIGFDQHYAVQIFGLFKRLNEKTIYSGSGIGLALCKKVVMNHGGAIIAQSEEGKGATFYVYLPQRPGNARAHPHLIP